MKVLHALDVYLPVSQNWIYPQIHKVKQVEAAVLTGQLTNLDLFPPRGAPVFSSPPSWAEGYGIPRLTHAACFRLGIPPVTPGPALSRWGLQIIHAHFGTKGWDTLGIRKRLGVPLVTSFYGTDAWHLPKCQPVWGERYQRLFAEGCRFLVEGPAMGERLGELGCPREKIQVLRLGVDLSRLPFEERDFQNGLNILMMARFVEKKGFPDGLAACAMASRSGVNLKVRIVGDAGNDDPAGQTIKAELAQIAGRPELRGRVTFDGFVGPDKAREAMRSCNVFLCPSKHSGDGDAEGGSPVALTEAMASGMLCIGTRHCDIPQVVVHGQTGSLADSSDIEGLASLLAQASREPANAAACARAGRAHIEQLFSTEKEVAELKAVYRSALGLT